MRVNLKWVLRDKDRHGNVRYYFRQDRTKPMVRLRGEPGSPEFVKSYNAAQDGSVPERKVARRLSEDSLEWLCRRYYESTEFGQLDESTQRRRRQILTEVCIKHGDKPFAMLEEKHIRALRNEKAATPESANQRVKALKQLFRIAKEDGLVDKNPTLEVRKLKSNGVGWHCWTDAEVEQFEMRHPIGTKAHLALGLLLYTAQRRSDVVLMGRRHIRNGWMTLTQQKNRKRNPVEVSIPVIPELQKVIEMSPTGELTFLVTDYGRPFSVAGFGNWFRDRCNEAGLPHCSAHGLRKAAATRLAEKGCTAKEIMAITGHKTLAEVQRYIEAAERKRLAAAAMAKLRSN